MAEVVEAVVRQLSVAIPIAAPRQRHAHRRADADDDPGDVGELLAVAPVDRPRAEVEGLARAAVMVAARPYELGLAGVEQAVLRGLY